MKKTLTAAIVASLITYYGTNKGIKKDYEKKFETETFSLKLDNKLLKKENYELHLKLIERDNPYEWKLYGSSLGEWGYRKMECDGLGACAYIYLEH